MSLLSSRKDWPFTGMLALSLVLGVAIAATVDGIRDGDELTWFEVFKYAATPLLIAAAMLLYARAGGIRLRDPAAQQAPELPWAQAYARAHPALLSTMDVGILFMSVDERVSYCNPAFLRIWKVPPERDLHESGADVVSGAMVGMLARPGEQAQHVLRTAAEGEADVKLDLLMADGRLVTQQSHAVNDAQGKALGRMWVYDDVTVERRNAKQLVQLAERDALTGLYNRHRFNDELARMLAEAQRNGTRLALLFFDIDGLKYVNESFGHRAGDAVLMQVANEVGAQVRRNEIFACLGGDDFAILVPDVQGEVLPVLAERVTRSISQARTEFEGQSLRVTCSCGVAVYPDHAANPDELAACADMAMYEAKEAGKNTWHIYAAPGRAAPTFAGAPMPPSPLSPEGRIRHVLKHNLLALHYQGIYATQQRTLRHYEVLLRVRDPANEDALLLTSEFIALAERSRRMVDIDRWVLGEAIRKLALDEAIPALAVNISGRSLDGDLPAYIESELKRRGVSPRRLMMELTETAAVSDLHDARRFIEALQVLGCGVSLDDFGTGFSSFAYLKHLPVDSIKIDGVFIRDLPHDPENQLFVRAIVAVARGLHKTTIAECVEDETSLKILASLGVDYVQGFYLQAPRAEPSAIDPAPGAASAATRLS